jgi:hypothetical protein
MRFAGTALLFLLLSAFTGCTGLDRAELTEFRSFGPDRFSYTAATNLFYGSGQDTLAEDQRLRWLGIELGRRQACPLGYEITSREVMLVYESPLGYPAENIVYEGRCRP